ncbi:peptide deformylase [Candidatus Peregrinibacteria bacterium CG10_big_fil_rev_8_21_14_0_10_49_24]|nr:MAG: peptide deformylase [Candidatus Peregrinibacteria bacterium CG11_big_fil_rev_8_21_14_0_20_49_14]PIR51632.1 MAG: peptide deformylase [Candidatus Peregrinibacteria bacterium CG10_big_fil_rev_8_21_14_0_10_49_24]PJA68008.1 MAG: peptide deformylase [Candidatus Peregrinibacteria bacterium CG_4_9_14_3_um_filter_49_12]
MAVLPIVIGENEPVLRKKTATVPKVTKEILRLLKDMDETVRNAEGAGIAAPQIGQSLRMCIALINGRYTPLINPEIIWRSEETDSMEEGCLSLPKVWLPIVRPVGITLRYTDAKGTEQERKLENFNARVVQHELDHLDGILIVDYPQQKPDASHKEHAKM